jgi:hypothetical protein
MPRSFLQRSLDAHRYVPRGVLRSLLARSLEGAAVALCLHRVAPRGTAPSDMVIEDSELDSLLELLSECTVRMAGPLTVSFDDGYADAARYVESRASRFPNVEWLYFVCPEKLVRRAGFRWDLGASTPEVDVFGSPFDVAAENRRTDLSGLADREDVRLLTVEECRDLRDTGVVLGNHTNCHFKHAVMTSEASREDIRTSSRDFERLFGKTEHFAFPFGTPGYQFLDEHVEQVREAGYSFIWSTEPRPYAPEERFHGAVLPRFPVFGRWSASKIALFVALWAFKWQVVRRGRALHLEEFAKWLSSRP